MNCMGLTLPFTSYKLSQISLTVNLSGLFSSFSISPVLYTTSTELLLFIHIPDGKELEYIERFVNQCM